MEKWKIRSQDLAENESIRALSTEHSILERTGVSPVNFPGNSGRGQNYHIWSFLKSLEIPEIFIWE